MRAFDRGRACFFFPVRAYGFSWKRRFDITFYEVFPFLPLSDVRIYSPARLGKGEHFDSHLRRAPVLITDQGQEGRLREPVLSGAVSVELERELVV